LGEYAASLRSLHTSQKIDYYFSFLDKMKMFKFVFVIFNLPCHVKRVISPNKPVSYSEAVKLLDETITENFKVVYNHQNFETETIRFYIDYIHVKQTRSGKVY
jgi:hypothetical protein